MTKWKLQDAKNKFSHLVDAAISGKPQFVTKRGEDAVVIVSSKDYGKLCKPKANFSKFLLDVPKWDDLEIERIKGSLREINL